MARVVGRPFGPDNPGKPFVGSGNPGGNVRIKLLSNAYRNKLADEIPPAEMKQLRRAVQLQHRKYDKPVTYAQFIVDTNIELACHGDKDAIREVTDRAEGKVTQEIAGTIDHEHGLTLTPFPDKAPSLEAWTQRYAKKDDAAPPGKVN